MEVKPCHSDAKGMRPEEDNVEPDLTRIYQLPHQINEYDCGLYALHYVECLMTAPIEKLAYMLVRDRC